MIAAENGHYICSAAVAKAAGCQPKLSERR
jgi:hypothetical protein